MTIDRAKLRAACIAARERPPIVVEDGPLHATYNVRTACVDVLYRPPGSSFAAAGPIAALSVQDLRDVPDEGWELFAAELEQRHAGGQ